MEFRDRTAVATAEAAAAAAPAASVPALAAAVSGKPTFVMSFVLKCAVDGGSEFVPTLSVFFSQISHALIIRLASNSLHRIRIDLRILS